MNECKLIFVLNIRIIKSFYNSKKYIYRPVCRRSIEQESNQSQTAFGSSSLQNTSNRNKFIVGHGSVKDLVKSYEELPNKEKVEVEFVLIYFLHNSVSLKSYFFFLS